MIYNNGQGKMQIYSCYYRLKNNNELYNCAQKLCNNGKNKSRFQVEIGLAQL